MVYIKFFVCFLVQMSGTYIFAKFMNISCKGEDVQRLQANKGLGRPNQTSWDLSLSPCNKSIESLDVEAL